MVLKPMLGSLGGYCCKLYLPVLEIPMHWLLRVRLLTVFVNFYAKIDPYRNTFQFLEIRECSKKYRVG